MTTSETGFPTAIDLPPCKCGAHMMLSLEIDWNGCCSQERCYCSNPELQLWVRCSRPGTHYIKDHTAGYQLPGWTDLQSISRQINRILLPKDYTS